MPTFSLIVPVYRIETYLPKCIDSVLAQTCQDYELLLVDDGSPDGCGAICDRYAARYPDKIRAIHQENGGAGAARNHGIADTPVTFACKAHLRNARPILLAVSTNDGLSGSAENLGKLLNRKHYYFVPFGQDSPQKKPYSLVADFSRLPEAANAALEGRQLQPILL